MVVPSSGPLSYEAFVDALAESAQFIRANPEKAADIFIRSNQSSVDRGLLLKIIRNPEVEFKLQPQNTYALAEFMQRIGAIPSRTSRPPRKTISSTTRSTQRPIERRRRTAAA